LAKVADIPSGALKRVKSGEREVVLCNCDGRFYAIERRCGHMNSGLDYGSLDGHILTCALHHVQFDVTTGEALNVPIDPYFEDPLPRDWAQHIEHSDFLKFRIRICNIRTYPTKIVGDTVLADLPETSELPCY